MVHVLPPLPYEYNSLEPEIDEQTMKLHHDEHHKTYVDKLNKAIENSPELQNKSAEYLLKNIENISESIRTSVRNNAGGHVNHSMFWKILSKDSNPQGEIIQAIEKKFGSFDDFKIQFANSAKSVFGSGWTWLALNGNELEIINTSGHDNPIMEGKTPLLVIDMWEHAYYLKYQNKKQEYIKAFFNIINWKKIDEFYLQARG